MDIYKHITIDVENLVLLVNLHIDEEPNKLANSHFRQNQEKNKQLWSSWSRFYHPKKVLSYQNLQITIKSDMYED